MLQNIRDNSQGLIAKFIIGLIIIPFALFGIDSLVSGGGQVKVAEVNGEDISAIELDQAVDLERRRRMNLMEDNFDPSLLDEKLIRGPALQQLISQRLLLQAADQATINISDAMVDQAIIAMPQFHENGQFSPIVYQNVLRSTGYTTAFFKQLVAKELLINQLNSGIAESDFITESELHSVAKIIGQQRTFRYLIMPNSEVANDITVSSDEIQQYYETHLDKFQSEEQVKLSYIEVKREDFIKPVPESELRSAYELDMANFNAKEERRVAHILVELNEDRNDAQALQLATEIQSRLTAGEPFSELAKTYSDDIASAQNSGDLGFTSGDTFPAVFERELEKLTLNQVSDPVKTDAGYHLIKATDIKSADKPSFSEQKELIEQRIQTEAAETELVTVVERLKDLVFNSEGLTGPAKELSLDVSSSGFIGRSSAQGVLARPQVIAAAFSNDVLKEGNNSEVMELSPEHFVVVSVLQHRPSAPQTLDIVRDEIVATLTQQKSIEMMLELGNQVVAQIESGKTFAEIAENKGYTWQIEQAVTRNATTVHREILITAFSMPNSSDLNRQVKTLANGDVAVIQLEKIIDGNWQQFSAAEQTGIKMELQRNKTNQSLNWFLESLKNQAEITVL